MNIQVIPLKLLYMHVFKIKPTAKTIPWLKENFIDLIALQNSLNMLYAEIKPQKRYTETELTLQTDFNSDSSGYRFGTNKIYICSDPDSRAKSRKQKIFVIFLHFLHEFRHWMQSEVLGVKDSQLHYTDKDMYLNKKKYWNNKYEVDARKFERKYVKRFMRYYINSKRVCL